jgi:hypothetical protein
MCRLLIEREGDLFLKRDGTWTKNDFEAHHFATMTEALTLCQKYKLTNMDLLLKEEGKPAIRLTMVDKFPMAELQTERAQQFLRTEEWSLL